MLRSLRNKIKWAFQKIFRKTHTSDYEVWELHSHLAEYILPKLIQYKKSSKAGYPSVFSEYDDNVWSTEEDYNKLIESGDMIGGGRVKWEEYLSEMIYAFEYIVAEGNSKKEKEFFVKYNCDWHAKTPENESRLVWYRNKDGWLCLPDDKEGPPEDWTLDEGMNNGPLGEVFYYDMELHSECTKRAQKGLELFGKYFMSLWD